MATLKFLSREQKERNGLMSHINGRFENPSHKMYMRNASTQCADGESNKIVSNKKKTVTL